MTTERPDMVEVAGTDGAPEPLPERIVQWILAALIVVLIGGLAVGAVVVLILAFTVGRVDPHYNPLNVVFASRTIVAAARLTMLFIAGYVMLSIVAHIRDRRWLSGMGPVKIQDSVQAMDREREQLASAVREAQGEIDDLRGELRRAVEQLAESEEAQDAAFDHITKLERYIGAIERRNETRG